MPDRLPDPKATTVGGPPAGAPPSAVAELLGRSPRPTPGEWVSVIRADQRRRWLSGSPLPLEAYLDHLPEVAADAAAFADLVRSEMALRRGLGESPRLEEYRLRFPAQAAALPDLDPARTTGPTTATPDPAAGGDLPDVAGLLLQFMDAGSLAAALRAWVVTRRPLAEVLREQGQFPGREWDDLVGRVAAALRGPGAVHAASEERIRAELERIGAGAVLLGVARALPGSGPPAEGGPEALGGRYQVLREHALGGIGRVSVALDRELNREVALKEIQDRFADEAVYRRRFELEAEVTGRLEHPGVVPVYGLGRHPDGRPFYAMRFIQGESLKEAVLRFHDPELGRTEGERLLELRGLLGRFVAVCQAVAYAHSKGVVHRDLKPANVMLGPFGEALVVDWGLAKLLDRPDPDLPDDPPEAPAPGPLGDVRTRAGSRIGTPAYMSPEQASGRSGAVGAASDIYSLGATLYTVLTGRLAFDGSQFLAICDQVARGDFVPPRQAAPGVPPALEAVCLRAMALKPGDRYATATDLAADVERWLADEPVSARPEPAAERLARFARRHRGAARVAAAALAVLSAVSVAALLVVNTARTSEWRAYEIDRINRDIVDGWQAPDWTAEHLDHLDRLTSQLADLDPAAATEARGRTTATLAAVLGRAIDGGDLAGPARARAEARLALLERRDTAGAARLRDRLARRLADWHPVADLAPPFADAANVLDAQPRLGPDPVLLPPHRAGHGPPVVPTRLPCSGPFDVQATFAATWPASPAVGLRLDHGDHGVYELLLTAPGYDPDNADDRPDPAWSLGAALQAHERIDLRLARGPDLLIQARLAPADGPLLLRLTRVGGRLVVRVNDLPSLAVDDPHPPPPGAVGRLALVWPAGVGLNRLRAERQWLDDPPRPFGPAEELFARGEFEAALDAFRAAPESPEAVYKQGECLAGLAREGEAVRLWEGLARAPAATPEAERWQALAVCRLARPHARDLDFDAVAADLDRLEPLGAARLAEAIPAGLRAEIVEPLRPGGARWLVAYRPADELRRLRLAARADRLLGEGGYVRRMTAWRLADAYRANGEPGQAVAVVTGLLGEPDLAPDERLALSRDLVWALLEAGQPAAALAKADELAGAGPGLEPLRLDRARALVALGRQAEAGVEVEQFFQAADRDGAERARLGYADFADACLLRGFLRSDVGDEAGAQLCWRMGLLRNWLGGLPPPRPRPPTGLALHVRTAATLSAIQLASLTGELTEAEARTLLDRLLARAGVANTVHHVGQQFPPSQIHAAMIGQARSERGRAVARRMAYRQSGLMEFYVEPLRLSLVAGMAASAFPDGGLPAGLEPVFWKMTGDLIDAYNRRRIDEQQVNKSLLLWGARADPARNWAELRGDLGPDLLAPTAYFLGRRYLAQKQTSPASRFFQEALRAAAPGDLVGRLAATELARLALVPLP